MITLILHVDRRQEEATLQLNAKRAELLKLYVSHISTQLCQPCERLVTLIGTKHGQCGLTWLISTNSKIAVTC